MEIWKFELELYEGRYTSFWAKLDIIFVFNYICTHKNYFKMEDIHNILVYISLHLTILGAWYSATVGREHNLFLQRYNVKNA